MQIPPEIQVFLNRVKAGETLSQSDRLEALDTLDRVGGYTATQIAEMLGVSERQVRRDRAKLRERYQQSLKDLNLVGELHRQFEITLSRMDQAIAESDYQRVRSLALRWGVCESFARIAFNFQIDELSKLIEIVKSKAQVNSNAITVN